MAAKSSLWLPLAFTVLIAAACTMTTQSPIVGENAPEAKAVGGFSDLTRSDVALLSKLPTIEYRNRQTVYLVSVGPYSDQVSSGNFDYGYTPRPMSLDGVDYEPSGVTVRVAPKTAGLSDADQAATLAMGWASDAALSRDYVIAAPGNPEAPHMPGDQVDPTLMRDAPSILANAGWPLVYFSTAQRASLAVYPDGNASYLLVRTIWTPAPSPEASPLDESSAKRILTAALNSATSTSAEGQRMRDYYIDTPFFYATASETAPVTRTPLYQMPASPNWSDELSTVWGHRVWDLQVSGTIDGEPVDAEGWVDADNRTLVRFRRPYRETSPTFPVPTPRPRDQTSTY